MPGDPRRSFMRAARAGSALALILDLLMLSDGRLSLWHQMGLLGGFFDAQGHALLHGHLSVPASSVSFEGFLVGGHTYMYFGPVPALLRLPVLLFTHALDGRLSQLSMLLALIVLLSAGASLHWRVRERIRPGAPVSGRERAAVFLLALALGAGGVPLFLASWPVVYHESELWGAAFSVAAINAVLAVSESPSGKRIAWAGALCTLAVNTRISVGLGPIMALALVGVLGYLRPAGGTERAPAGSRARALVWISIAVLVALGSEIAINELKFHTPFGLPMYDNVDFHIDPMERAAVIANHGSLIGAQYLPTSLLALVRPDAIGLVRAFPFIGLPHATPTVIGSVRFISLLPSLSAVTSMPLFCLLLVLGLPALVRRRPCDWPLLGALAATALAYVPTLLVATVATRYLSDLLPFLWLGACAGMHALAGTDRLRSAMRARRVWLPALGAVGALTLFGIAINGAVGIVEQRLLAPTTTPAQRASFIRTQDDIDRFLGRRPHGLHTGSAVPRTMLGPLGDLFVLGRCDGLYVESFGGTWLPAERTEHSGLHELEVRFPRSGAARGAAALLTLGTGPAGVTVVARGTELSVRVGGRSVTPSLATGVRPGRRVRVTASIDPLGPSWYLSLSVGDRASLLTVPVPYRRLAPVYLGADPGGSQLHHFRGSITALPETAPVCDLLARRAGLLPSR